MPQQQLPPQGGWTPNQLQQSISWLPGAYEVHAQPQAAVAASSATQLNPNSLPYHGAGAEWAGPAAAESWPPPPTLIGPLALPPVLPSQDNSSWHPTMPLVGPVGFAAPPSPPAPLAATDPGGEAAAAALLNALEQLNAQRQEMRADQQETRAEARAERLEMHAYRQEMHADRFDMQAQLADARSEIRRLTDQSAEMRKEMDNARWGNSWGSGWWNNNNSWSPN